MLWLKVTYVLDSIISWRMQFYIHMSLFGNYYEGRSPTDQNIDLSLVSANQYSAEDQMQTEYLYKLSFYNCPEL